MRSLFLILSGVLAMTDFCILVRKNGTIYNNMFYTKPLAIQPPSDIWYIMDVRVEDFLYPLEYYTIKNFQAVLDIPSDLEPIPEVVAAQLEEAKAAAIVIIDTQAEDTRSPFITPGFGQTMAYEKKAKEADKFLKQWNEDPESITTLTPTELYTQWPHIVAEVGITADTPYLVAYSIYMMELQWQYVSAYIEQVRLSTKNQIKVAPDKATVKNILDSVSWDLTPLFTRMAQSV